jgi:hypothetical protein
MEHPPEDTLLRFLLTATTRQENRQIVRHLLARCPSCAAALRRMWKQPPADPPLAQDAYDAALDRFAARLRELARPPHPAPPLLSVLRNQESTPNAGEGDRRLASAASGNATPKWGSG